MNSTSVDSEIVDCLLDMLPDGLDVEEFYKRARLLIGNESEPEIDDAWCKYCENGWDFSYPSL